MKKFHIAYWVHTEPNLLSGITIYSKDIKTALVQFQCDYKIDITDVKYISEIS